MPGRQERLLHDPGLATGTRAPFAVISGYRSARTNAFLRDAALDCRGGVGYYAGPDFVHVDRGRGRAF